MKLELSNISPALALVCDLDCEKNNDLLITHIFNTNDEAKSFYENDKSNNPKSRLLFIPQHSLAKAYKDLYPVLDKKIKFISNETLWLHIGYYNGCTNETICTTTLLKEFIDDEAKNPYFEAIEITRI